VTRYVRFECPPAIASNRNGATAPATLATNQSVTLSTWIPGMALI
jgi:hypothetical protein